jgi:hypothetical protein
MLDLAAACKRLGALEDGARVRLAVPSDLPNITRLASDGLHPETVEEVWALARLVGPPFLIVEIGGELVAICVVMSATLELGAHAIAFVQPEFVTTDVRYRRRGFVRAMFSVIHDAAAHAGVALSLVHGIEYFYRQFGYSYAIREPIEHVLTEFGDPNTEGYLCRLAELSDLNGMDALQASVQRHVDLRLASTEERWSWLLAVSHYELVVVERNGRLEAMARVYADEVGIDLSEIAARSVPAADALLSFVRERHPGRTITVPDRAGGGAPFLDRRSMAQLGRGAYYLCATTLDLLLRALVPIFNDRLARSSFAESTMTSSLSLYVTAFELVIENGSIVDVREVAAGDGPPGPDICAIPPDRLVDAVFGDLGAIGMEKRHPDVLLGDQRLLMRTLFPSISADLLLY